MLKNVDRTFVRNSLKKRERKRYFSSKFKFKSRKSLIRCRSNKHEVWNKSRDKNIGLQRAASKEERVKDKISRPEVFCKKGFLKISQNSQENTCARISVLIKVSVLKKRLCHRCFPVNFAKFLRTPFLIEQNTSGGCFWKDQKVSKNPRKQLWKNSTIQ